MTSRCHEYPWSGASITQVISMGGQCHPPASRKTTIPNRYSLIRGASGFPVHSGTSPNDTKNRLLFSQTADGKLNKMTNIYTSIFYFFSNQSKRTCQRFNLFLTVEAPVLQEFIPADPVNCFYDFLETLPGNENFLNHKILSKQSLT